MAHPYVLSQEGLLCLPAQERGGDARRQTLTQGELERAKEGQQPSICSCVWGGTGGALLEPYKLTSSGLLVCIFLTKLSETPWAWHEGSTSPSGISAYSPALCSSIGICQTTPELAGFPLTPRSLCSWEQVHSTWDMKESGDVVANVILPVTSSSMNGLAVGQWWCGEAYHWRVAQTSTL